MPSQQPISSLLESSKHDYLEDFEEIKYLLDDSVTRLEHFLHDISKTKKHIAPTTGEEVTQTAKRHIDICNKQLKIVREFVAVFAQTTASIESLRDAEKINSTTHE